MKLPAPAATTVAAPIAATTRDLVDITPSKEQGAYRTVSTRFAALFRGPGATEDSGASPAGHIRIAGLAGFR
jgi:hypothetical protein